MGPTRSHALLLNLAHLLDHFFMLIFPTAILAISAQWGLSFSQLLPLSLPAVAIFGLGALPAGWLADRWSRRGMMAVFFFGIGTASSGAGVLLYKGTVTSNISVLSGVTPSLTTASTITED